MRETVGVGVGETLEIVCGKGASTRELTEFPVDVGITKEVRGI